MGCVGVQVGEVSQPGPPDAAIREFDMTVVDSSEDEPATQLDDGLDSSSTETVHQ